MGRESIRTQGNPLNALFVLATAAVVFFAFYARQSATEFLYQPPRDSSYERDQDFRFVGSADETQVNVFWVKGKDANKTVLYFCGRSEDLGLAMPLLRSYQLRGFNVASFEYRGFGYTKGKPKEASLFEDGLAVFDFIVGETGGNESNIILHGHSLGGAIAMEIATRRDPRAIILESSFTSAYDVLLSMDWIPGDLYRNKAKADLVDCPVLFIHGENDSVIPLEDAVDLANRFNQVRVDRYFVPNAGYYDLRDIAGSGYWSSMDSFIRKLDSRG